MDDAIRGLGCRRAAAQHSRRCAMKSSGYFLLSPPAPPDGPGRPLWELCGTLRRQGLFDHTAQHVQVNHKGSHEAIVDLVLAVIRPPKLCDDAHHGFRVGQDWSVALDGKTSRRSHDRAGGQAALHLVSAFATTSRLVLGQEAVADKSNETTAIPALLERLGDWS